MTAQSSLPGLFFFIERAAELILRKPHREGLLVRLLFDSSEQELQSIDSRRHFKVSVFDHLLLEKAVVYPGQLKGLDSSKCFLFILLHRAKLALESCFALLLFR